MNTILGDRYVLKRAVCLTSSQYDRLCLLALPSEILVYHTINNDNGGLDYLCRCRSADDEELYDKIIAKEIVDEFYVKQIF